MEEDVKMEKGNQKLICQRDYLIGIKDTDKGCLHLAGLYFA